MSFRIFVMTEAILSVGMQSAFVMTDWSVKGWVPRADRRFLERCESIWVSKLFRECLPLKRM